MIWFVFVSRGCHNKYFKLGSLTYRNLSSHSSGDQKSEVRCKQDHAPSEGGRKVLLVSLLHPGNSLAWSREILTVILTGCSLEEVIQRAWPPVHLRAARGKTEALHSLRCPGHVRLAHHSRTVDCFKRCFLERAACYWVCLGGIHDGTQLRPQICKILAGRCGDLLVLQPRKKSLLSKFSCLLKLLPTNPGWPASFLSVSLPSVYGPALHLTPEAPEFSNQRCSLCDFICVQVSSFFQNLSHIALGAHPRMTSS